MNPALVFALGCVALASGYVLPVYDYDNVNDIMLRNTYRPLWWRLPVHQMHYGGVTPYTPYHHSFMNTYDVTPYHRVMWGMDKDIMYSYLAKKIDLDMMKVLLAKYLSIDDIHNVDIDMMRTMMARHFGMDINMLDVHTMKMIMVKKMMDAEMLRTIFARHIGKEILDLEMMKTVLAKYVGVGINMLEDIELMKMVMIKYMIHFDMLRMMGTTDIIGMELLHRNFPYTYFHRYMY